MVSVFQDIKLEIIMKVTRYKWGKKGRGEERNS